MSVVINKSCPEIVSSPRLVTEPFRAALNGDWEGMKRFYEKNREAAALPLTLTNDTPLYIAIYSGGKSPLEELLQIVPNDHFARPNDKLNTPFHEAGVIGNMEAAQVLLRCSTAQLDMRNILGETPMFRAAAFVVTKMVQYLAAEVRRVQGLPSEEKNDDEAQVPLNNESDNLECGQIGSNLSLYQSRYSSNFHKRGHKIGVGCTLPQKVYRGDASSSGSRSARSSSARFDPHVEEYLQRTYQQNLQMYESLRMMQDIMSKMHSNMTFPAVTPPEPYVRPDHPPLNPSDDNNDNSSDAANLGD
ncbi:hypothetical protein L484_014143 [Morus notabilis]|uniref:Uncharacterized protein n=1 Tax=Morus notabilis TaxID=981085 RepID=W9RHD0_9ROSA|nr:hypothetical protein L484_014143 [Morus notabilis]